MSRSRLHKDSRIYVAGHRGMVGSAVVRCLKANGYNNLLFRTSSQLDLRSQAAVDDFMAEEKPDAIVIAAAKVGGIHANNTYPAEFFYDNMALELNLIQSSFHHRVGRLLFLGSTCIYPRLAEQPIEEDSLLSGSLEQTNEAYALAKIGGLKMCQYYRNQYGVMFHSAMPTNLYGPGDNYHPQHSHVIPGMIHRFHDAKVNGASEVKIWGTGKPRREFLHVDDLAEGLLHLLQLEDPPDWVNVGTGKDIPIIELAHMIKETVGFEGEITHDLSMPDGTPRKLTDISRIKATGWEARIPLDEGLREAYDDFKKRLAESGRAEVLAR